MRARILALLLLAGAAGCASDFEPRSYLADLRVLALVADRPEIGFGETTRVTAHTSPVGAAATGSFSFCPYSLGASTGYACLAPQCELPLPVPAGSATATIAPQALLQECLARLGTGGLPAGLPGTPPDRVEAVVRFTVRDDAAGLTRESVLRLPVTFPDPPAAPNHNPVILRVEIGGQEMALPEGTAQAVLTPGAGIPIRAVLGDPETTPAGIREGSVISFFTTAGRFDYDRALGPDGSVQLEGKELAGATSPAEIWVVARDLRGGQAIAGPFSLDVRP